jgi:hypothetical protein
MSKIDPHIFEITMLFCFGASWPFAIAKTIRTKVVRGKSIVFITLVCIGYLSGIISKLVGEFDHVIWLYTLNGSMVFTEMVLYFKYNRSPIQAHLPAWQSLERMNERHGVKNALPTDTLILLEKEAGYEPSTLS